MYTLYILQVAFSKADQAKVLRNCGDLEESSDLMNEAIDCYSSNIDSSSSLGYQPPPKVCFNDGRHGPHFERSAQT